MKQIKKRKTKKKEESKEGLTVTKDNFSEWYPQVILKSDLVDYSLVSGCSVYKPKAYSIWEKVVENINREFKKIGIKNAYFPLFIPESLLNKEKVHVKGFKPEVAWVTHTGDTKLAERLAVRPTSEAIMYDSYSKWIKSYRDLPLRLNQWNNVVRWEFKNPVPFLRGREFLWNEGHTAFSNKEDAEAEGEEIIKIYSDFIKEYMALPGLIGKKTEKEKFAGAEYTITIELYLPNGRAIQGPDFHHDGQNFAKAYDIKFLDEDGEWKYVYQNTFAISTRMLGVMIAMHSDDKGLIIPPKLAEEKVVIIPILFEESKNRVLKEAEKLKSSLREFNAFVDNRLDYTPGWKFHEWELKGIPIRLELGPKDLENKQVVLVDRLDNKKRSVKMSKLKQEIKKEIERQQDELYKRAEKLLRDNLSKAENISDLKEKLREKKIVLVPMCKKIECEDYLKEKTGGAKTLNIPFEQPDLKGKKCIHCGKQADYFVYVGKSY